MFDYRQFSKIIGLSIHPIQSNQVLVCCENESRILIYDHNLNQIILQLQARNFKITVLIRLKLEKNYTKI